MPHRILAATIVALAFAVLAAGCGSGGTKWSEKTLSYTEKDMNDFSFQDNPPKSPATQNEPKLSNGDQITFTSGLVDSSGATVGRLDATCTVTSAGNGQFQGAKGQCNGTATLSNGTLALNVGGKPFTDVTTGAIVGGSGDYEGATGSFTSTNTGDNTPNKDEFHFFIPKK